jgi:hypothetical protein
VSNIEPYRDSSLAGRSSRERRRLLNGIEVASRIDLARLEAAADFQTATADAVAHVGRCAMHDVALLSQVEQQLATAVPIASGRLAAIADLTAVALSEVVAETATRLRRV